jgi:YHS domain-containing protein
MMLTRRTALSLFAGLGLTLVAAAPVHAAPANYTGGTGAGASGYDVVAYFTQSKPVRGKASITASYNGVEWRFSSEANKALFVANPGKYAPKYGGYCAWAVAHGVTAAGSPQAWSIVGGRLYLNINKSIRAKWKADASTQIRNGNKNWPSVLN